MSRRKIIYQEPIQMYGENPHEAYCMRCGMSHMLWPRNDELRLAHCCGLTYALETRPRGIHYLIYTDRTTVDVREAI